MGQFKRVLSLALLLSMTLLSSRLVSETLAQTTSFTYQGRFQNGGTNANGDYDFQFTFWNG